MIESTDQMKARIHHLMERDPSRVSRPRGYLALAGISPSRVSRPCGYRALAGIAPLRVSRPCGYRALRVSPLADAFPAGYLPPSSLKLCEAKKAEPSDYGSTIAYTFVMR